MFTSLFSDFSCKFKDPEISILEVLNFLAFKKQK